MAVKKSENFEQKTINKLDEKDIEKTVIELANQGITAEKIGTILKQKYKIKAKLSGKKISKILKENSIYKDPGEVNLRKKVEALKKHIENNKQDYKTKRALLIYESRLSKLLKIKG